MKAGRRPTHRRKPKLLSALDVAESVVCSLSDYAQSSHATAFQAASLAGMVSKCFAMNDVSKEKPLVTLAKDWHVYELFDAPLAAYIGVHNGRWLWASWTDGKLMTYEEALGAAVAILQSEGE